MLMSAVCLLVRQAIAVQGRALCYASAALRADRRLLNASVRLYVATALVGGLIAWVAILHGWLFCMGGRIAWVVVLRGWPYCMGGHVARVAVLHGWSYCTKS